jgi:hypothetical protein
MRPIDFFPPSRLVYQLCTLILCVTFLPACDVVNSSDDSEEAEDASYTASFRNNLQAPLLISILGGGQKRANPGDRVSFEIPKNDNVITYEARTVNQNGWGVELTWSETEELVQDTEYTGFIYSSDFVQVIIDTNSSLSPIRCYFSLGIWNREEFDCSESKIDIGIHASETMRSMVVEACETTGPCLTEIFRNGQEFVITESDNQVIIIKMDQINNVI